MLGMMASLGKPPGVDGQLGWWPHPQAETRPSDKPGTPSSSHRHKPSLPVLDAQWVGRVPVLQEAQRRRDLPAITAWGMELETKPGILCSGVHPAWKQTSGSVSFWGLVTTTTSFTPFGQCSTCVYVCGGVIV